MLKVFLADESGATAIEYAMIAALIAVAIIPVLILLNESMVEMFDYIRDHVVEAIAG